MQLPRQKLEDYRQQLSAAALQSVRQMPHKVGPDPLPLAWGHTFREWT